MNLGLQIVLSALFGCFIVVGMFLCRMLHEIAGYYAERAYDLRRRRYMKK